MVKFELEFERKSSAHWMIRLEAINYNKSQRNINMKYMKLSSHELNKCFCYL